MLQGTNTSKCCRARGILAAQNHSSNENRNSRKMADGKTEQSQYRYWENHFKNTYIFKKHIYKQNKEMDQERAAREKNT